ncbi:MAG TPA: reverse transcriptase-like protein, partial [Candidatus Acetothermia bacterium]|nr:reverse transcriptase-like protein [Candidatus Acetothermia bacterium]
MQKLFVYVSGVAKGDPGPAAVGLMLTDEAGHVVERVSLLIGRAAQRVAEFKAVLEGARRAASYAPEEAVIITDSAPIANFISGVSHPREPHLLYLRERTLEALEQLSKWRV